MKKLIAFTLSPVALAMSFPAVADKNWSGAYFGGTLNQTNSTSKSTNTYANNGATPPVGWTQSQFKGNLLNSIDSMAFDGPGFDPVLTDTIAVTSLGSGSTNSQNVTGGSLLAGINSQYGRVVLGAELRAAFGNFGATSTQSASGSGEKYMSDFEGPTLTFTNYNSSLSGISSPVVGGFSLTNSVNYSQTVSQQSSIKYNNLSQAIGRAGYSFGDVLGYLKGGLAYANVKANTSASVSESANGTLNNDGTISNYTGSQSYSFSGQTTKNMYGYTVGAGAEWALQENLSFRFEAEYYNLGSISAVGTSSQTGASYSVSQQVSAYNISVGLIRKF